MYMYVYIYIYIHTYTYIYTATSTELRIEFGKTNPASSSNLAACHPKFAHISMALIRHRVTNHGRCIMTTRMKCLVMKAKALCSGNSTRYLGSTSKSAPPRPTTTGACSPGVLVRSHHPALPGPAPAQLPRRGFEGRWQGSQQAKEEGTQGAHRNPRRRGRQPPGQARLVCG